jgi:hypothetical protein
VSLADGPTVEIQTSGLKALRPWHWALSGGLLVLLIIIALLILRRKSAADEPSNLELDRYEELRARVDGCRALRLEGKVGELALGLTELELELADDDEEEQLRLKGLIESLRFGGQVPPSSDLDRIQRSVERRIENLRPDPDQVVRSRLRMTRETS